MPVFLFGLWSTWKAHLKWELRFGYWLIQGPGTFLSVLQCTFPSPLKHHRDSSLDTVTIKNADYVISEDDRTKHLFLSAFVGIKSMVYLKRSEIRTASSRLLTSNPKRRCSARRGMWFLGDTICRQTLVCTHRRTGETGTGRRIITTLLCPPSGGGILKQNVFISHLHLDTCHSTGIEMSAALRHVLLTESCATFEGKTSPGAGSAVIFLPSEIHLDIAWQLVLPKCISSSYS